jgi:preprotein translocase subunit SecE
MKKIIKLIVDYLVGAWEELKRVSWPSRKDVLNHTVIVITSLIIAIGITSAIDYGLTFLIQLLVQNKS